MWQVMKYKPAAPVTGMDIGENRRPHKAPAILDILWPIEA